MDDILIFGSFGPPTCTVVVLWKVGFASPQSRHHKQWPLVHLRIYISPSHYANLLLLCSIGRFPHARLWYLDSWCFGLLQLHCSNLKVNGVSVVGDGKRNFVFLPTAERKTFKKDSAEILKVPTDGLSAERDCFSRKRLFLQKEGLPAKNLGQKDMN